MKLAHLSLIALASSAIFSSLDNPVVLSCVVKGVSNFYVVEAEFRMIALMWAAQNGHAESASLLVRS